MAALNYSTRMLLTFAASGSDAIFHHAEMHFFAWRIWKCIAWKKNMSFPNSYPNTMPTKPNALPSPLVQYSGAHFVLSLNPYDLNNARTAKRDFAPLSRIIRSISKFIVL